MRRNCVAAGAAVLVLSAGLFFLTPADKVQAAVLPSGLSAEGFNLEGMTKEEAKQKLDAYAAQLGEQTVMLTLRGTSASATAGELGLSWLNREVVEGELARYAGGNLLERYLDGKALAESPLDLKLETAVDEAAVGTFAAQQFGALLQEAKDAVLVRENGVFQITDSAPGLTLDAAATKQAIDAALKAGMSHPGETIQAEVSVSESQPVRTREALETVQDVLGTFSTSFNAGNASRTQNLKNGASKVNGIVLMPGEEFSAYASLTPFSLENGYAAAGSYENGQVVDSIGGGACQLCTTLYNTALLAELEITQRQNHSMVVGYVPPSQDAAIAGTVKDLKFKNSWETPIYIEGTVNGGTLTFTIYGKETRPSGREIRFVSETIGTTDPGEPSMKVDPSLSPGARVKVQSAHTGLQSRLWKYVYVDGVETERQLLHTDQYMASKAIYRVGPQVPAAAPVTGADAAEEGKDKAAVPDAPVLSGTAGGAAVSEEHTDTGVLSSQPENNGGVCPGVEETLCP